MLIGSALHTLELEGNLNNVPILFEQLVLNDSSMRLRRLPSDMVRFNRYLAQTSTLRDLRIAARTQTSQDLRVLVQAFRANGSLVRVRIYDDEQNIPLSFRSSISARNAKVAILMRAYDCDQNHDAENDCAIGTLSLSLAPSLFAVAQQTPRTAANIILTGLLALSDSLCTGCSDMRMRH
jgi:hypothetical protein